MAGLSNDDHVGYADEIVQHLQNRSTAEWNFVADQTKHGNYGRLMVELVSRRLHSSGSWATNTQYSIYRWGAGAISMKNSRVAGNHWSTAYPSIVAAMAGYAAAMPAAYLFTHLEEGRDNLHFWVVPEPEFRRVSKLLPKSTSKNGECRILYIEPNTHRVLRSTSPVTFDQFAGRITLMADETYWINAAIAADDAVRDAASERDPDVTTTKESSSVAEMDLLVRRHTLFEAEAEAIVDIRASTAKVAALADVGNFDTLDSVADEMVDALRRRRHIRAEIDANRAALHSSVRNALREKLPDAAVELLLPKNIEEIGVDEKYSKLYRVLVMPR